LWNIEEHSRKKRRKKKKIKKGSFSSSPLLSFSFFSLHSHSLSTLLPFFVLMVYNSRTERKRHRIVGPETLANIDKFLTEFTSPDFSANDADFLAQGHAEVREDAWAGELNQFSQEIELKTDSVAVSPSIADTLSS